MYPDMAKSARIAGTVIIEATIGADGKVINAKVLRFKYPCSIRPRSTR